MTQPSQAFDLAAVEHDLDQSLDRLRIPALYELPAADQATIADTSEQQTLQPIRRTLEVEWQRRLVIERGENSLANLLTPAERREREQYIFMTALRQLLPLARKLAEADRLLARLRNQPAPGAPSNAEAIERGLQALAAADLSRALSEWASADAPEQVAVLAQERREQQGQELLRQATAVFARLPDLTSDKERADLRTTLRRDYIEPVRRIGTELQREKAQQVSSAVDAALNLGRAPEPAPGSPPPPLPPAPAVKEPPRRRRTVLIWGIVGAIVAVIATMLLAPGDGSADPVVTRNDPVPSMAASVSTELASVAASAAPAVVTTTAEPVAISSPAPTPTVEVTPSATPTPPPNIVTTAIDPPELYAGRLPAEMTVRGTSLDLVREAQLIPERGAPMPLEIQLSSPEQMTVRLTQLPEALDGAVATVLYLNGSPQETLPIMVRDYLISKTVQGVKADYRSTGRVRSDGLGAYTTIHGSADATTSPVAPLRNGEQVEVLRDDAEGWYEVRIRVSNDPAQVGATGWVERWLIDDQNVPQVSLVQPTAVAAPAAAPTARPTSRPTVQPPARPTTPPPPTPRPTARPTPRPRPPAPAPSARAFVAEVIRTYPGTGRSEDRESCIEGRVRDRSGGGIGGAVVSINNGAANLDRQTNGAGEFQFCGLGDSTWSVVLRYVPGSPGLAREVAGTVYVNGSAQQSAAVNFREP